jgi:chorismate synthase
MGSSFGRLFRVTTFGESHGPAVGAVVEGCPPGIPLSADDLAPQLARRRPGASRLTSRREEPDEVEIVSGVWDGRTLGSPIALLVRTRDANPSDYAPWKHLYRPSHADFTTDARFGHRMWAGGGRASARETVGRVAAGAVAERVLASLGAVSIVAWTDRVADVGSTVDEAALTRADVDRSEVRCPDLGAAVQMAERIVAARKEGDTVGGVLRAVVRGVPAGLGDPVFDKLEADLGKALLSIPAARGFEVGSGYAGAAMRGSQHNDRFEPDGRGGITTATNHSGGIQGGISNGMPIRLSLAMKPVATLLQPVETVDEQGQPATLQARGRHDPCVLPRAVPVVEAMIAIVVVDHWLRWRGQVGEPPPIGAARAR